MARDLSGMSFGTTSVQPENKERSAGEILADAGIGMLRGAAAGKGILGILAGGALGAIEGDVEAERKQRMADLAEQQAKVELENARNRGEFAANQDKRNQQLLELHKQQFKSGVKFQEENLALAKAAAKRQEKNDAYNKERNAKLDAQNAEKHAVGMKNAKTEGEILAIKLEEAENKRALTEAETIGKEFDSNMASVYGDEWDFEGMSIMRNSAGYRQARELYIIMKLYDRNPQMAQRLMKQGGWSVVPRSGTNGEEYDIVNDVTGARFAFNETSMKALQENIQKNFNDGYMAGKAIGSPAGSLQQAAVRSVLTSKESQAYFGTQYDAAYADYRNFMQAGVQKGLFSDQDVATHVLSRTLQEAMRDRKLTKEEMAVLVPQFQMSLQKFGGEIIPGADLKTTTVRMKDGTTITLDTLAEQLQQRDVIGARYKLHLDNLIGQRKAQESKAEEEFLKREKHRLEVEEKQLKVKELKDGDKKKVGNEIPSPEEAFEDKTLQEDYKIGVGAMKSLHLPETDDKNLVVHYGQAYQMANNAFKNSGLYCDAQVAWDKAHRQMGNNDKTLNNKGQRVFLNERNIRRDLKTIEKQIQFLENEFAKPAKNMEPTIDYIPTRIKYLKEKKKALQDLKGGVILSKDGKDIFEILDDQYKSEVAALRNKIEAEKKKKKKKKEFEEKAKKDAEITSKNSAIMSEEFGKEQAGKGMRGGYVNPAIPGGGL